jgi:hypothetical protein
LSVAQELSVVEIAAPRTSLTSRLLDRMASGAQAAATGVVLASAAGMAQAVVAIPETTITLEDSYATAVHASGWFTNAAISGTTGGQVAGTLGEGFKLYGNAELTPLQYNTGASARRIAMVWWGRAQNLRQATYGYDADGNSVQTSTGDRLAFNYEFTLEGDTGASVSLEAGFTNYAPNRWEASIANTQGSYYQYLTEADGGSATFKGTIQGSELDQYSLNQFDEVYWVVKLVADQAYAPSSTLRLTVPQNSIDIALNQPPITAVPEPEAITLVLSGLLATWLLGRRRRC